MMAGRSSGDSPTASAAANKSDSTTGRCISRFIVSTKITIHYHDADQLESRTAGRLRKIRLGLA